MLNRQNYSAHEALVRSARRKPQLWRLGLGLVLIYLISFALSSIVLPLLAALFFLFGLASMGVPGTSGFPAEFLLILSALDTHTGAGLAALAGVVLGAAYFLGIYRRAFLGQIHNSTVADAIDLRARELVVIVVMGILILIVGFYPDSVLELTRTASEDWVSTLSGS